MPRDNRVILIAVVLGLGAIFSVYKAISAFSVKDNANSLPSPAFVAPPRAHITADQYVVAPRLPSDVEVGVLNASRRLGDQAASLSLSQKALVQAGMAKPQAAATVSALDTIGNQLIGRQPQLAGVVYSLTTAQETKGGAQAVVQADVPLLDPKGLVTPETAHVTLTWSGDRYWSSARLTALKVVVQS